MGDASDDCVQQSKFFKVLITIFGRYARVRIGYFFTCSVCIEHQVIVSFLMRHFGLVSHLLFLFIFVTALDTVLRHPDVTVDEALSAVQLIFHQNRLVILAIQDSVGW
jgi:hypothetical protein